MSRNPLTRPPESSHIATTGGAYYPEMGETHDGAALFRFGQGWGRHAFVSWPTERHTDALALFAALRVRPKHMRCDETINGGMKWSASVTWAASDKMSPYSVNEMML